MVFLRSWRLFSRAFPRSTTFGPMPVPRRLMWLSFHFAVGSARVGIVSCLLQVLTGYFRGLLRFWYSDGRIALHTPQARDFSGTLEQTLPKTKIIRKNHCNAKTVETGAVL